MVQPHSDDTQVTLETIHIPLWAKILEPIVALAILWFIFEALKNVFA